MNGLRRVLTVVLPALVSFSTVAGAAPITAYEVIEDTLPYESGARDLRRTRSSVGTGTLVEHNDAAIVAQNGVNALFGEVNSGDVVFQHNLTWVTPFVGSYLTGELLIGAWGNSDFWGADAVLVDSVNLGNLSEPGFFGSSTSAFGGAAIVNALVADGILNITINKNASCFLGGCLDDFSVFKSQLTISYEPIPAAAAQPLPEPATLALLGTGLSTVAVCVRRRSRRS